MMKILAPLHHPATAACVEAERELQRRMEGGCQVPLGCHGEVSDDGELILDACIGTVDGRRLIRSSRSGPMNRPKAVAEALVADLDKAGAREILASLGR
jgi:hydroxymethylbilane synthase